MFRCHSCPTPLLLRLVLRGTGIVHSWPGAVKKIDLVGYSGHYLLDTMAIHLQPLSTISHTHDRSLIIGYPQYRIVIIDLS